MKWPWVSRRKHENVLSHLLPTLRRIEEAEEDRNLMRNTMLAALRDNGRLQEKLELSQASERAERLKRLRAEGLCQWKDDRIRGALQLLYREDSGVKKAG